MSTKPISRMAGLRLRAREHCKVWCWYGAGLLTLVLSVLWVAHGTVRSSYIERAWTLIAVYGLLFSIWLAGGGWWDLAAVREAIHAVPPRARAWGPRWWVGLSSVVANGMLCLVWLGFIAIGVIAMQFPPPTPSPDQQVSNQWAGWVLIAMEALLVAVQAWHLFVRNRVERAARWTS